MSAGKWYWEIKCIDVSGNGTDHQIGIARTQAIATLIKNYPGANNF